VKKRRRKESINHKSASPEIHANSHLTTYASVLPNTDINHQPNCRYHPLADSLSVATPPSLCPSLADAPAASPEQSDIIDSVHTATAAIEVDANVQLNNDPDNSSIPSVLLNRLSLKQSIKSNYLDFETVNKILQQNQCDCYHHQNDISDQFDTDDEEKEIKVKRKSKLSQCCDQYIWSHLRKFRQYISNFVASKYFRRIVLSAIVVNTLSMGIEYHGQPTSLTNALEYSNIVFTSLFAIEMILKIIADGCLKYIKNAYNLFDGGIVIMSVIELQGNKNSGLSVLRTFRLLRVLKLVRFMPTLRRQLVRKFLN
jgi:hypothetical protein